jgi:hypothetical protein
MQSDDPYPYDAEVEQLCNTLNAEAGRVVAHVIVDPDTVFEDLRTVLPIRTRGRVRDRGLEWDKAVSCSGPHVGNPPETLPQTIERVLRDFETLREISQLDDADRVSVISDDFYSKGIECEVSFASRVLTEWLPLPQAIFVCPKNLKACLYVTFARSGNVFASKQIAQQGAQPDTDKPGDSGHS